MLPFRRRSVSVRANSPPKETAGYRACHCASLPWGDRDPFAAPAPIGRRFSVIAFEPASAGDLLQVKALTRADVISVERRVEAGRLISAERHPGNAASRRFAGRRLRNAMCNAVRTLWWSLTRPWRAFCGRDLGRPAPGRIGRGGGTPLEDGARLHHAAVLGTRPPRDRPTSWPVGWTTSSITRIPTSCCG